MRHRRITFVSVILALVGAASVFWLLPTRSTSPSVTISFSNYATNSAGQRMAMFRFVNRSHSTVVSPDDCMTQSKDTRQVTRINLRDIILRPGDTDTFMVTPPVAQGVWRVGLGQYPEDWKNKLRIRLDMSWIGRFVPRRLRAVPAYYVWSDWLTE